MSGVTGNFAYAAAGVKVDSGGGWYGPIATLPAGTPYTQTTTGSAGTQTVLTVAGAANAYTIINGLYISGSGLPVSLTSVLMDISGLSTTDFKHNLWSGPALGLVQVFEYPGWGLVSSAQNTSLVVTVPAMSGVTVTITAIGIYV